MAKGNKKTKGITGIAKKETVNVFGSSNGEKPIWVFDRLDRSGEYAFNVNDEKFEHKFFLDKMISYSSMTWNEILSQTHDDGKSKNHTLDYDDLSKTAQDRIKALRLEEDTDRIFSFAFRNKLRIIGLRENEKFYVKWYDPEHEFCPSTKKHK